MSVLADLLLAEEPLFSRSLDELRVRSGHEAADAQLVAELATKSAAALAALGVGPESSGQEVFTALMKKAQADNQQLIQTLGGRDEADVADVITRVVKAVHEADIPRDVFVLKTEVAASMLRKHPPKNMIAQLGYTAIDTMLEREDIFELFIALRFTEGAPWLERFNTAYAHLTADDFESRTIKIVVFSADKWGEQAAAFVKKKFHNITHSKELGAVGVLPVTGRMPGAPLKILSMILHYHNEVRLYSAFFKLMQYKKNFGKIITETLIADTPPLSLHAGQHIHWRVIQRYYGKLKDENHPQIFEPHVHPEDLHFRLAEETLFEIDPSLGFWRGLDYVGRSIVGETISFNLIDVAFSYSNGVSYAERYLYHFREALWNEIFARFMGSETLRQQILTRLDNDLIKPEELVRE